ncbi:MAG: hypothetical protein OXH68_11365 [Gammaproteobacteria bacterium]|nr:hypothetical protein [Gammaproteobacteria bacterium]
MLALIPGLGLYNATAQHFLGNVGQKPVAESSRPAPAVTDAASIVELGNHPTYAAS